MSDILSYSLEQRRGLVLRSLLLLNLLAALLLNQRIDYLHTYSHVDLAMYRQMAQAAPGFDPTVHAPFAYRFLVPYLSGWLFPDDVSGFQFFALAGSCLLSMYLLLMLQRQGLSKIASLFLCTLLLLQPYLSGFVFYNIFQAADLLSLAFLIVMIDSLLRKEWLMLSGMFLLAACTRETAVFIVPVALLHLWRARGQNAVWIVASLVPGLAVWTSLRMTIPVFNPEYSTLRLFADYAPDFLSPEVWFRMLFNACTPLCFLPLVWWKDTRRFISENAEIALLVPLFALTACIGGDKERLLAPIYVVLLLFLGSVHRQRGVLRVKEFAWLLLLSALLCGMHFQWANLAIPDKRVYYAMCALLDILVAVAALRMRSLHKEKSPAETTADSSSQQALSTYTEVSALRSSEAPVESEIENVDESAGKKVNTSVDEHSDQDSGTDLSKDSN